MTQKTVPPIDMGLRLIVAQDCRIDDWVHITSAGCPVHGYWRRCTGVNVGEVNVRIWLWRDSGSCSDIYEVEIDDTIVICSRDPREDVGRG